MASRFGGLENDGCRFRIHVKVAGKHPEKLRGPSRSNLAQAEEDLAQARRCCSTREQMYQFISDLASVQALPGFESSSSHSYVDLEPLLPRSSVEESTIAACEPRNPSCHQPGPASHEIYETSAGADQKAIHPLLDGIPHSSVRQDSCNNLAISFPSALDSLSTGQLRQLASQTPGISRDKKVSTGKWIPKTRREIIADYTRAERGANQALPGMRSALAKKMAQRKRQTQEQYKVRKRQKSWQMAIRLRERLRQTSNQYKEKKRTRENAPAAKLARGQRRQFTFWKDCFRKWNALSKYCRSWRRCVCHSSDADGNQVGALGDAFQWQEQVNTGPYAPCFHAGGRFSLLQHGVRHWLPRCDFSQCDPNIGCVNPVFQEYRLALDLRCRLGLQCLGPKGCSVSKSLQRRFDHTCPLASVRASIPAELLFNGAVIEERWDEVRLPEPPCSVRRFLCNRQCPAQCCTVLCPWRRLDSYIRELSFPDKLDSVISDGMCSCGLAACTHCALDVQLSEQMDWCLQDPPVPGYRLYQGFGEQVSDRLKAYKPKVYILLCKHLEMGKLQIGQSYAHVFHQLRSEQSSVFPKRYANAEPFSDGLRIRSFDYMWNASQRDLWLKARSSHIWEWEAIPDEDWPAWEVKSCRVRGIVNARDLVRVACEDQGVTPQRQHLNSVCSVREGCHSMICNFCNFVSHGRKVVRDSHGHTHYGDPVQMLQYPPEDIALRAAVALAVFQGWVEGRNPILRAADVIAIAHHWAELEKNLETLAAQRQKVPRYHESEDVPASGGANPSLSVPSFVWQMLAAAQDTLLCQLQSLSEELAKRTAVVLRREQDKVDVQYSSGVFLTERLEGLNKREVLMGCKGISPIFAIVGEHWKLSDALWEHTPECNCHVPWHRRSLWERRGFVDYRLPPAPSLWHSVDVETAAGILDEVWIQHGSISNPAAVVTLGMIPTKSRLRPFPSTLRNNDLVPPRQKTEFHRSWTLQCVSDSMWKFLSNQLCEHHPTIEVDLLDCWHEMFKEPSPLAKFLALNCSGLVAFCGQSVHLPWPPQSHTSEPESVGSNAYPPYAEKASDPSGGHAGQMCAQRAQFQQQRQSREEMLLSWALSSDSEVEALENEGSEEGAQEKPEVGADNVCKQESSESEEDEWSGLVTPTRFTSGDVPLHETPEKTKMPQSQKVPVLSGCWDFDSTDSESESDAVSSGGSDCEVSHRSS